MGVTTYHSHWKNVCCAGHHFYPPQSKTYYIIFSTPGRTAGQQHLSNMQILPHTYLDLTTLNTKDLMLLMPSPSQKFSGKRKCVHTPTCNIRCFNETMHY